MTKNLFECADKAAWLAEGKAAMVNEKSAVLSTVAAFAFFALFAGDNAKKELQTACVDAGHYLPKKPGTVNMTYRNRVSAALALVEREKPFMRETLEGITSSDNDDVRAVERSTAINALIGRIITAYTPGEAYPLTIANKFMPMLTADWTAEQCLAALAGEDMVEPEATEAELDKEADEPAEADEPHADKLRRAMQNFTQLCMDIPARDAESYLILHTALDTFARAALKAQGVYDVVNQNGAPVLLGGADEAIVERLAVEYNRATSHAASIAAEGKREAVLEAVQQHADAAALERLEAKHGKPESRKGRKAA